MASSSSTSSADGASSAAAPASWDALKYNSGFDNEHATEALPGALPAGQNSPQKCPYGLYAEQLSGTAFTVPRARNRRSWLYRIRPAVLHSKFVPYDAGASSNLEGHFGPDNTVLDPNQMRWFPQPLIEPAGGGPTSSSPSSPAVTFINGLHTMGGCGDPVAKQGMAIHTYNCNASMVDTAFQNSDGDFLIVPQAGALRVKTEMGLLYVRPKEIVVVQRGIRFSVGVEGPSRGYVCEIFQGHFQLPDLGPIGSNGLANARDFLYPVAHYEDAERPHTVVNKFGGKLFSAHVGHSPFDVVAWHGNYAPFKYDLERFNTMNSVSFDHPDPSIYTVLTCPSDTPGVAICDFVIFPPRWMVMERSFRPPWFHRNVMTEFMGMVWGKYDAKVGFQPGGASLHSCCTAHGPDADTFLRASNADLKPEKFEGGLAFMFETSLMLRLSKWAVDAPHRDLDYQKCWSALPRCFNPEKKDMSGEVLKPAGPAAAGAGGAQ